MVGDLRKGIILGLVAGIPLVLGGFWAGHYLYPPQTQAQTPTPTQRQRETTGTGETYSNREDWEFVKDGEGMIQGVRIHRMAEEG